MQNDIVQHRVAMRGAMDTCCSLWTPIFSPADIFTPAAIPDRVDSGDGPSQEADSDVSELPRK